MIFRRQQFITYLANNVWLAMWDATGTNVRALASDLNRMLRRSLHWEVVDPLKRFILR